MKRLEARRTMNSIQKPSKATRIRFFILFQKATQHKPILGEIINNDILKWKWQQWWICNRVRFCDSFIVQFTEWERLWLSEITDMSGTKKGGWNNCRNSLFMPIFRMSKII